MKQLSKKEVKELNSKLEIFDISFNLKDRIFKKDNLIFVNDKPMLIEIESKYYPTLFNTLDLKSIYVDKGAIPFVVKGADIMAPGISRFDSFLKDDIVFVKDDSHNKVLALGIALINSEELEKEKKGKAIKTYNFVGDKIWESYKSF